MELKVKEEFVRAAHSAACSEWKSKIETEFPDLFKKTLQIGEWYKSLRNKAVLINYQGELSYGWGTLGMWTNGFRLKTTSGFIPATPKEVKEALIAEAKNRGYVHGAKFKSSLSENGIVRTVRVDDTSFFDFYSGFNKLTTSTDKKEWENKAPQSNPDIFKDGKWAELLPEEKTVITLDKAKKILAKKFKTTVEQIEIK